MLTLACFKYAECEENSDINPAQDQYGKTHRGRLTTQHFLQTYHHRLNCSEPALLAPSERILFQDYAWETATEAQLRVSYNLAFQKHMVNGSKVNFAQDCNRWFNSLPSATQLLGPVQGRLWKPDSGRGRTTPCSAEVNSYTRSAVKWKGISSARSTSSMLPSQRHIHAKIPKRKYWGWNSSLVCKAWEDKCVWTVVIIHEPL